MNTFPNKDIRFYIYIDTEGIDSLYHQIIGAKVIEKAIETDCIEGDLSSSIGNSGFLKSIMSAEIASTLNVHHQETQESKTIVSVEQKIKSIQEYLSIQNVERLEDIIKKPTYKLDKLIACKAIFRLVQAFDEDDKESLTPSQIALNPYKYKHLSFVFNTTKNINRLSAHEDLLTDALTHENYFVDMVFGKEKMVRSVRHITTELKYGADFMFFVLGELSYEGSNIFCLKPYAVWRQTNR